MSDRPESPDSDKTQLRQPQGQSQDDEKTVIRKPVADDAAEAPTVVRGSNSNGNGNSNSADHPASDQAAESARVPAGSAQATILRAPGQGRAKTRVQPSAPVSSGNATILRQPGEYKANARTQVASRSPQTPAEGNATILRAPSDEGKTVLRKPAATDDDSTVLRAPLDDDSTLIRQPDDDSTLINPAVDDDSTVIGAHLKEDTTYVASVGKEPSRGNSEAGRLLKNRFVLEEKVGSGGMGDVYKALDLRQQEAQERNPYIAIKILNDSFSRHKDAFISLQREATRTRGIPHPNIMAVYDFDKEGDTVFMSMELLDGKPLDDYLKEHPEGVSVEDSWNIIDGICKGLSRAHAAGIVHSDFKPGNIYYTESKMAKVFDFGIARAVSTPGDIKADGEKTVFDAGSLGALTPTYASYEMLTGQEPTKSDDVYAVALVAYELFTGKHPYGRTPADKALERGLEPKPIPFLKRRHWRALKKGLELKGENRTQTIDEFYEGMFSEDPHYIRYSAIAAVVIGALSFGVYSTFFLTNETPQELVSLMGAREANQNSISNRLKSPNFTSEVWVDDLRDEL
ncbi:MAG: serine/threonine protein kinase, partial [Pseudomonadales bacterium]|nr:serine/threonine protein kinase [Pseudomonadales bacterium]